MKNNRVEIIDEFLKYWKDIAKENPNLSFDNSSMDHTIYNKLIRLGVKDEDKKISLNTFSPTNFRSNKQLSYNSTTNSAFNNWLTYYQNNDKIRVFQSPRWEYFCQFKSPNLEADYQIENIKVYVPLDSKHIEEGAKRLFNFLSINNIPHTSKIGKNIRFDDIVIRLVKKEDADKLLSYIKSDNYIQEGLITANPFTYNKDGIALACDGQESYNLTICSLISMYISNKKNTDTLDNVGYLDFYKFIAQKYQSNFITKTSNDFNNKFNFESIEQERNYREIIALILKCQNPNFTYDDYIDHFNDCRQENVNNIHKIRSEKRKKIIKTEEEAITLLKEYIDAMISKYEKKNGIATCIAYLYTGRIDYITRTNNLRQRIANSNLKEIITMLAERNGVSLQELINEIYPTNYINHYK